MYRRCFSGRKPQIDSNFQLDGYFPLHPSLLYSCIFKGRKEFQFSKTAKTIFANNSKSLIGWQCTMSTNHWLNFSGLKDVQNVPAKLIVFEIRPKKYVQTGAWAQISMDFVYWTTCNLDRNLSNNSFSSFRNKITIAKIIYWIAFLSKQIIGLIFGQISGQIIGQVINEPTFPVIKHHTRFFEYKSPSICPVQMNTYLRTLGTSQQLISFFVFILI